MRAVTLQDWITVQAYAASDLPPSVLAFNQPQPGWLDVSSFADATFWIDVTQVVAGSGVSVQLVLQSSPTLDESYFQPVAPPVTLASSPAPVVVRTVPTATSVPLARFLRWQLKVSPAGTTGTWGATFRIRVATSPESFFVPTQVSGCVLWLRADLGITPNGSQVQTWADQSGKGNNFSQITAANQPTWVQSGGAGGQAYINCPDQNRFLTNSTLAMPSICTVVAVVNPSSASPGQYAHVFDGSSNNTLTLNQLPSAATMFLYAGNQSPQVAIAVNADQIVTGIFNGSSSTISIDNGATVTGSPGATAPAAGASVCGYYGGGGYGWLGRIYEVIAYSRQLSTGEATRVARYLGSRYGIAVS